MAQIRYSKQRETIYEILKSNPLHPSVDEIYKQVRKIIPDISLGTVYRNLNVLVEQKRITCFDAYDKAHYDIRVDPHFHFACKECGKITDVEINEVIFDELVNDVESKTGNKLEDIHIVFYGVCSECKEEIGK